MLRLPRKTRRRPKSSLVAGLPRTSMKVQCCGCHTSGKVLQVLRLPRKNEAAQSHHLSPDFRMKVLQVLRLPRKKEPEMLQVLRLPRKTSRRCSKCCACHAKRASNPSAAPATQNEPDVVQVLRLPRKTRRRLSHIRSWTSAGLYEGHSKCRACHAKAAGGASSAACTTQNEAAGLVAGLPRTSMKALQVLRLPRKTSWRCSKCCACRAKRGGAQSHHS